MILEIKIEIRKLIYEVLSPIDYIYESEKYYRCSKISDFAKC